MAGLDPAIHALLAFYQPTTTNISLRSLTNASRFPKGAYGPVKPGHDERLRLGNMLAQLCKQIQLRVPWLDMVG